MYHDELVRPTATRPQCNLKTPEDRKQTTQFVITIQ